jgi:hypothetical protein
MHPTNIIKNKREKIKDMTTNTMLKLKKPIEQLNPPLQHMDFEKGSPQASHLKRETIYNGNKTTHVCQCVGTQSAE